MQRQINTDHNTLAQILDTGALLAELLTWLHLVVRFVLRLHVCMFRSYPPPPPC